MCRVFKIPQIARGIEPDFGQFILSLAHLHIHVLTKYYRSQGGIQLYLPVSVKSS